MRIWASPKHAAVTVNPADAPDVAFIVVFRPEDFVPMPRSHFAQGMREVKFIHGEDGIADVPDAVGFRLLACARREMDFVLVDTAETAPPLGVAELGNQPEEVETDAEYERGTYEPSPRAAAGKRRKAKVDPKAKDSIPVIQDVADSDAAEEADEVDLEAADPEGVELREV